jgi:hypothetical protein
MDSLHQGENEAFEASSPSFFLFGRTSLMYRDFDKYLLKKKKAHGEGIRKHYELLLRGKETQYEILEFKFDRVQSEYEAFKALKSAEIEALKAENMALKSAMLQLEER